MLAATTTELVELEPVGRVLFVLGRHVIALFAFSALQNNVISWHFLIRPLSPALCPLLMTKDKGPANQTIQQFPTPFRRPQYGRLRG